MTEKIHYRKAFDSPYLSSADIVEPTVLTVARVNVMAHGMDQTGIMDLLKHSTLS